MFFNEYILFRLSLRLQRAEQLFQPHNAGGLGALKCATDQLHYVFVVITSVARSYSA